MNNYDYNLLQQQQHLRQGSSPPTSGMMNQFQQGGGGGGQFHGSFPQGNMAVPPHMQPSTYMPQSYDASYGYGAHGQHVPMQDPSVGSSFGQWNGTAYAPPPFPQAMPHSHGSPPLSHEPTVHGSVLAQQTQHMVHPLASPAMSMPFPAAHAAAITAYPSPSVDSGDSKKEKRKSQVRDASRRRRAKRKDEETRLRERIQELTQQIQIMGNHGEGGDVPSTDALNDAYEQQLKVVQLLQEKNQQYKDKLAQHEQFARLIQSGIHHLSDASPPSTTTRGLLPASASTSPPLQLTSDWMTQWAASVVRGARDELVQLQRFSPEHKHTNVAMGWTTELWTEAGMHMQLCSRKAIEAAPRDAADKTWDILTSLDKCRRVYPELKSMETIQRVNADTCVVTRHCVPLQGPEVHLVSVVFRTDHNVVGVKSFDKNGNDWRHADAVPVDCFGWTFGGDDVIFCGSYSLAHKTTPKAAASDLLLAQYSNETMFSLVRWESEAIRPVFRIQS
ncbi:Aste57867_21850 [Aphanomyces stellatus]|uniref:Aste57867_21850 protein n=1 Tax=Aphanomyces stellatus TaxID=120398 RepID=A0A485LJA7_9STRA|nr:hypothetical protein As57867_021781 [Aphanomyces stellatus]VFT98519.1 Aste57867_21850 [Aphanomyces stellatus]